MCTTRSNSSVPAPTSRAGVDAVGGMYEAPTFASARTKPWSGSERSQQVDVLGHGRRALQRRRGEPDDEEIHALGHQRLEKGDFPIAERLRCVHG